MFAKLIIIAVATPLIAFLPTMSPVTNWDQKHVPSILGPATVHAQEALKAGMVDPKTGKKIKYWAAPMDPTYIRNEPGKSPMGMDLVPVYEEAGEEKEPSSTIRIDPVTQQNMGVRLGRVERKSLSKSIRTFGTITYDETGLYSVNTKFNGWIETLYVDFLGEPVEKGQPLFDIYSPDLLTAQQEYLIAVQQQKGISGSVARMPARETTGCWRPRAPAWPIGTSPTNRSPSWRLPARFEKRSRSSHRPRVWSSRKVP